MRKESPTCSLKPSSSTALLESLFGKRVANSLAEFKTKSPAEKAMAVSRSRVRALEIKLKVARRTTLAVSRVRRKQLASADLESITLAGKVAEITADRDLLLIANRELLVKAVDSVHDVYDQKRMRQSMAESNRMLELCEAALLKADKSSHRLIFTSYARSGTQVTASSITKIINSKPLPGGMSSLGRT